MIDRETETQTRRAARRWNAAAALVAAGLAGGIVALGLVSTGPAAATASPASTATRTSASVTVPGSSSSAVAPRVMPPSGVAVADDPV